MRAMFKNLYSPDMAFDQDISGWDVGLVTSYSNFDQGKMNPSWSDDKKPTFG